MCAREMESVAAAPAAPDRRQSYMYLSMSVTSPLPCLPTTIPATFNQLRVNFLSPWSLAMYAVRKSGPPLPISILRRNDGPLTGVMSTSRNRRDRGEIDKLTVEVGRKGRGRREKICIVCTELEGTSFERLRFFKVVGGRK